MPTQVLFDRRFDARPDRIDFRDLPYRAPLVSLPDQYPSQTLIDVYFPLYRQTQMVLNQGKEGACTGFGLAAVVNYLRWESWLASHNGQKPNLKAAPEKVSTRMLYQNARLYDEWKGEDYEGSSCRGAMKGFHKHGVCSEPFWPYKNSRKLGVAQAGWDQDAAQRPLGAYYRIDAKSIVEMQAAIYEVHAIYVSCDVHDGWALDSCASLDQAIIRSPKTDETGGHAFAIVGYTSDGFIVQNSWGPRWGFNGFALLPYEDWTKNGNDAWTLALGAPMKTAVSPRARTDLALDQRRALRAPLMAGAALDASKVTPWMHGEEADHIIFIGHHGRADRELVAALDGDDAVRHVVDGVRAAIAKGISKVAIYDHGGLNDRQAGINRAKVLGPWFEKNDVYPIFVVWQTGFLESSQDIIHSGLERLGLLAPPKRVEGWFVDKLKEMKDRAFEVFARDFGVKAIWENMKSRADEASAKNGGLDIAAKNLKAVMDSVAANARPEIHLLGHSAGAIMQGYFLGAMKQQKLKAKSLHLWAPACTVSFASKHFGDAFKDGVLRPDATFCGVLSDDNEKSDPCVPVAYSKSLLYLISRALEPEHKTPVPGMQKVWPTWRADDDTFSADLLATLKEWDKKGKGVVIDPPVTAPNVTTMQEKSTNETIKAGHGSFDNNIDAVNLALTRILGAKPKVPVTDLRGF